MPWHWGWFSVFSKHGGSGAAARLFYHSPAIPRIVSRINHTCFPSSAMPWNERSRWSIWGMVHIVLPSYGCPIFVSCFSPNTSCSIRFRHPRWMCVTFFFTFPCAYLANAFFQVWISITAYLHFMCQSSQDKKSLADRIGKCNFYRFRNYLVDINFTLQQQNSHQCLCVTIRCLRHFLYLLGVKLDFSYILSVRYSQTRTRLWVSLRSVWRIGIVNFGEFTTYLSCSYVTLLEKF